MEYLKSILRQEVGWFDNRAASSTTFQVIATISSDAHSIQDVISENVSSFLKHTFPFLLLLLFQYCKL